MIKLITHPPGHKIRNKIQKLFNANERMTTADGGLAYTEPKIHDMVRNQYPFNQIARKRMRGVSQSKKYNFSRKF